MISPGTVDGNLWAQRPAHERDAGFTQYRNDTLLHQLGTEGENGPETRRGRRRAVRAWGQNFGQRFVCTATTIWAALTLPKPWG